MNKRLIALAALVSMQKTAADTAENYARALIRRFEKPQRHRVRYKDPKGISTVGPGINLQAHAKTLRKLLGQQRLQQIQAGKPMTGKEMNQFIKHHVQKTLIPSLRRNIPTFDQFDPRAKGALISAAYNSPKLIGPRLKEFLGKGEYAKAIAELAYGHKAKLKGLRKRRLAEADLLAEGFGYSNPRLQLVPQKALKPMRRQWQKHPKRFVRAE